MDYVEQPVTTKINLLTLFLQQLRLFVPNPRDRAQFMYCGKRKKEKEGILCAQNKEILHSECSSPLLFLKWLNSKPKLFQGRKLTWNVGHLTSYAACFLDASLLDCRAGGKRGLGHGLWSRHSKPAMDSVCVPQNSYTEILTSTVMEIGSRFLKVIRSWGGVLRNGIRAFIKGTLRALLLCEDPLIKWQSATQNRTLARTPLCWHLELRLPASRTMK